MRAGAGGQLDLGHLRRFLQAGHGAGVAAQVHPGRQLEALGQRLDQAPVHVGAAEPGVARGGLHLEHPLAELHDRDVERAAAEVDHRDPQFLAQPVEAIGERGGGGLVDQAHHFKAGDLAGILGGAALVVVEVGRDGDHRLRHRLAEESLGIALDLLQQKGRQLLGGEGLVAQLDDFALPHPALEGGGGAFRVGRRLAPGGLADQHLAVGGHRHVAGEGLAAQAHPLGAGNDDGTPAAQHGGSRVGRSQIDADDRHDVSLFSLLSI